MNRAWSQWYTEATSGSRIERLLRRGASKVRRRMLRRDFDTWNEAIMKKANTKRLLQRICIHTYRRLLRKGMKKWEQYLEMILLQEHENHVLKNSIKSYIWTIDKFAFYFMHLILGRIQQMKKQSMN